MPTDVYVKFGTTKEVIGPYDTPRPKIDGDSTDAWHYWWCELRNCGFDLEAKDPEPKPSEDGKTPEPEKGKEQSKSKFQKVTLTKRVDWASTQLFTKCCEQALALKKPKNEQEETWIDTVTVEVCRPAGGDKVAFAVVNYHKVRITHYSVNISAAEPSESITFEFQELDFKHTRTDPFTGRVPAKDAVTKTTMLPNAGTGQSGTAQGTGAEPGGGASPGAVPTTAVVALPTGGGGTASSGAGATPAAPATAVEIAVSTNFPGLWQGTGFGVLPD
jgi:type VI protein secretion system component Hcp